MTDIDVNDITGAQAYEALLRLGNTGRGEQMSLEVVKGFCKAFLGSMSEFNSTRVEYVPWWDEYSTAVGVEDVYRSNVRANRLFNEHYNILLPQMLDDESLGLVVTEASAGEFIMGDHPVTGEKVEMVGDIGVAVIFPVGFCGNKAPFAFYCDDLTNSDTVLSIALDSEKDDLSELMDAFEEKFITPNMYEGRILSVNPYGMSVIEQGSLDHVRISDEIESEIAEFTSVIGSRNALLKKAGLPTKRGMLFAGPPGTGKTVTAAVTARRVLDLGGTVLYPEANMDISQVMDIARMFEKALVVFEDVESFAGRRGESSFTTFLNAVDGVGDRGDILTLSTTNNSKDLDKAVLRAGRMDQYVEFNWFTTEQVASVLMSNLGDVYDLDWATVAAAISEKDGKVTGAEISSLATALILRHGDDLDTAKACKFIREAWVTKISGKNYLD